MVQSRVIYKSDSIEFATKVCGKCGEVKLLNCFYNHSHSADGKNTICKKCHKEYNLNWSRTKRVEIKLSKRKSEGTLPKELRLSSDLSAAISKSYRIEQYSENTYRVTWVDKIGKEYSKIKTHKGIIDFCHLNNVPFKIDSSCV